MRIERKSDVEIDNLAKRIVKHEIYITNSGEGIRTSFPLVLSASSGAIENITDCGALYEEWNLAGERSCNGYPMFFSGNFLHKDDLKLLRTKIDEYNKILEVKT